MKNKKKWTIIMQISAENNLFDDMLNVMQELYAIRAGLLTEFAEINFIAVFDGLKAVKFSTEFALPSIYEVKPNTSFLLDFPENSINGKPIGEDLSDKRTLSVVYKYIRDTYPAEQFGYIYKGHGGAATGDIGSGTFYERIVKLPKEVLNDEAKTETALKDLVKGWSFEGLYTLQGYTKCNANEQYVMVIFSRDNEKALSYRMMGEVLTEVFPDIKLDFVFLDCCWGMQLENAYTFKDSCQYFIASADEMPAAGIGYTDFLNKIVNRPQVIGREIANLLLSVYFTNKYDDYDSGIEEFEKMGVSLTNLRTADMDFFISRFNVFCDYLKDDIGKFGLVIKKARECCQDYTYADPLEYAVFNIDLIWFLENLSHFNDLLINDKPLTELINELIYILAIRLRYGYLGNNYKQFAAGTLALGGKGITITFPETKVLFDGSIFAADNKERPVFIDKTSWKNLLEKYYHFSEQGKHSPQDFLAYYHNTGNTFNKLFNFIGITDLLSPDSNTKIRDLFALDSPVKGKWGKFVPVKNH